MNSEPPIGLWIARRIKKNDKEIIKIRDIQNIISLWLFKK